MKDITTEEAIDRLKHTLELHTLFFGDAGGGQLAFNRLLNELENKDKIIDAMAEELEDLAEFLDEEGIYTTMRGTKKEEIKQYFERKVKDERR